MSLEERIDEALKILGVAVVSLIGIALEEVIEKALITALPLQLHLQVLFLQS